MSASVVKSIRGNNLLVFENFTFSKDRLLKNGEIVWRCSQRNLKCQAKLHTIGSELTSKSRLDHNHQANEQKLNRHIIFNACKQKAVNDVSEKPSKILRKVLATNLPKSFTTTDSAYVSKNVSNWRRKIRPTNVQVHDAVDTYSNKFKTNMASCGALDCKHNNLRNTCNFFRLPVEPVLKAEWLRSLRRDPNTVPKVMFVCSCHFRDGRKENGPELCMVNDNYDMDEFDLPNSKNFHGKRQKSVQNATEFGLAKLRAAATNLESEPSTSAAASNDDYEIETKSDLPIEHVDVGAVSTSCEEQSDSNLDFLPESEEPPLPTYPRVPLSAPKDMKPYCRLCLNPVTKVQMICLGDFHDINYPSRTVQFKRNKILQTEMYLRMIRILLPNFDHDLVFNPVMCNDCSTRLQLASDFVVQCMATQNLIKQFKDTHCPLEKMVSCEDVVYSQAQLRPSDEGPSQPKQRKIVAKPSTSKSVAKSKTVVQPSPSVEQPSEMPILQSEEEYQQISESVNVKMESIDDEEIELEDKYEITQEEICYIKQEHDEEAPPIIKTDDAIQTNVPIKTECEYPLPSNPVVKIEPCSTTTSDSTLTTDPNSFKQFSTADVSCNVNSAVNSSSSFVHKVDLPSDIPISNYYPDIQAVRPETCISAVNPTAFSSVKSQFENSQNR